MALNCHSFNYPINQSGGSVYSSVENHAPTCQEMQNAQNGMKNEKFGLRY